MVTVGRVCRFVAVVMYLALGAQGVWGAVQQLGDSDTLGRQSQTAFQIAFGLCGLAAGIFLIAKRGVPAALEWAWVITLALAGGIAAVAWGETSLPIGIVAGASTALVALLIVWIGRRGKRA